MLFQWLSSVLLPLKAGSFRSQWMVNKACCNSTSTNMFKFMPSANLSPPIQHLTWFLYKAGVCTTSKVKLITSNRVLNGAQEWDWAYTLTLELDKVQAICITKCWQGLQTSFPSQLFWICDPAWGLSMPGKVLITLLGALSPTWGNSTSPRTMWGMTRNKT